MLLTLPRARSLRSAVLLSISTLTLAATSVALAGGVTFEAPVAYSSPTPLNVLTSGDLDGNGALDVIGVDSQSGTVQVWLGNGDGTFLNGPGGTTGAATSGTAASGDLDGNSFDDVAIGTTDPDGVALLFSDGTGLTTEFVPTLQPARSVALGDLNGDGALDLIVGIAPTTFGSAGEVQVHLNDGAGTFSFLAGYPTNGSIFDVKTADFDSDSNLDVIATSPGAVPAFIGAIQIFRGDGAGGLSLTDTDLSTSSFVAVGDFDEDGVPDVAATVVNDFVCAPNYTTYRGTGTGTIEFASGHIAGCFPFSIAVSDFDGDQHLDLALGDYFGPAFSVRLGDGDGQFPSGTEIAVNAVYPIAADLNGDGRPDLASLDSFAGNLVVHLNTTPFPNPLGFVRGDVNLDLAVDISDAVSVLAALFTPGSDPVACPDAADANDDGAVDVSDPIATLSFLFSGGLSLPDPFPACGVDPTADGLAFCAGVTCP